MISNVRWTNLLDSVRSLIDMLKVMGFNVIHYAIIMLYRVHGGDAQMTLK